MGRGGLERIRRGRDNGGAREGVERIERGRDNGGAREGGREDREG